MKTCRGEELKFHAFLCLALGGSVLLASPRGRVPFSYWIEKLFVPQSHAVGERRIYVKFTHLSYLNPENYSI
jgi:hypothetical protein